MAESGDEQVFGRIVVATEVEEAVKNTLQEWMPTYLRFIERHIGKKSFALPNPKSYTLSSDWDHFPEEQIPAILIMSSGISKPEMDGRKEYRGIFDINVGIFVKADDRKNSEQLAKNYGAAIRALILGKGSLGKFAQATIWDEESYGVHISGPQKRTFGTAEVKFSTEVRQISKRLAGPALPLAEPQIEPEGWPLVTKKTQVKLDPEKP